MTPEEADRHLADAIRAHAAAYGMTNGDEMLNEYVVVAHWQRLEDDGSSPYTVAFDRPTVPLHTAIGLFSVGLRCYEDGD